METIDRKLKFFIVDDDRFCAIACEQYLKNLNYEDINYFCNVEDCLNELHQKPDIIFLDHNTNDLNGFEVLIQIKRYDPSIYVIMISAQESIENAINAIKHGAFDYWIKDNNICEKINKTIEKILMIKEEMSQPKFRGLLRFL